MSKFAIGDKATLNLPDGLQWPAVCVSETEIEQREVAQRVNGLPTGSTVTINVSRATFISLRETKPDAEGNVRKYLALSNEVIDFGYRPVTVIRGSTVIGLDATVEGAKITWQENLEEQGVSYSAFQRANFEARRGATAAADL